MTTEKKHPFEHLLASLGDKAKFYNLTLLKDERLCKLPYSIRILLENAVRNCDNFEVKKEDVENILNWAQTSLDPTNAPEIPFKPSRVLLQDFTGVPALVDLTAMRDAIVTIGGKPEEVNPKVPVELVIDHSVQVDHSRDATAYEKNRKLEMERNAERFSFLKWGSSAFKNVLIVPPSMGIVHQVNLEYLARGVFVKDDIIYPDSLVGTDSHTTMIDALGIVGWGVGGIEAEAVMMGEPISMLLPQVVGVRVSGRLSEFCTATDLVLTVTQILREKNVVSKFVEFFGSGIPSLKIADRATIANMAPEYGATMGFFPVDEQTLEYFRATGRDEKQVQLIGEYFKAVGLFRTYDASEPTPTYSGEIVELNLNYVEPCLAGPKRPQDRVPVKAMPTEFKECLTNPVGFKGFGLDATTAALTKKITVEGKEYTLEHGSVVIAAITSCTNTSNPEAMVGAGLLAKKAFEKGLRVKPYIKTSLSPGSQVAFEILKQANLLESLSGLGFFLTGFGCQTCIGNSGDLDEEVMDSNLVLSSVLSGNRNFEGRVHPVTRANYLTSPMMVVAYALTGNMCFDFHKEDISQGVCLKDIWPSKAEITETLKTAVKPTLFTHFYNNISHKNENWNQIPISKNPNFDWDPSSTYIHFPPYLQTLTIHKVNNIQKARCILNLGDSVTTDHISPAGKIATSSPAGKYLQARGVASVDFNSYGARRGHDEVMSRGTFANIRLVNKLASVSGPTTLHITSGKEMSVYGVVKAYEEEGIKQLIVLAGKEYGTGSSRDWAAKGTLMLNIKAVIAQTFERIHRSNLIGMGVLPLEFLEGQNAETLGLTGKEFFDIELSEASIFAPRSMLNVTAVDDKDPCKTKKFQVRSCIYTEVEGQYYVNGGILPYVLRKMIK